MIQQISVSKLPIYGDIKEKRAKCSAEQMAEGLSKAAEILEVLSSLQIEMKHSGGQR